MSDALQYVWRSGGVKFIFDMPEGFDIDKLLEAIKEFKAIREQWSPQCSDDEFYEFVVRQLEERDLAVCGHIPIIDTREDAAEPIAIADEPEIKMEFVVLPEDLKAFKIPPSAKTLKQFITEEKKARRRRNILEDKGTWVVLDGENSKVIPDGQGG